MTSSRYPAIFKLICCTSIAGPLIGNSRGTQAAEIRIDGYVVPISPNWSPRSSNAAAVRCAKKVLNLYVVKWIDGSWLFITDEWNTVAGWARRDEVVPLDIGLAFFERRIQENARDVFNYLMCAKIMRHKKRFSESVRYLQSALLIAPGSSSVFVQRSAVWREMGDFDKAISDLNRAIELAPTDPLNYYNRAWVYHDKGDLERGIRDLDEAITHDNDNFLLYYSRASFWRTKRSFEKAMTDYTACIQLNPGFALAYNDRGLIYTNNKNYRMALQDFDRALRYRPNAFETYNNRGLAQMDMGQTDRAISDFDRSIHLNPKNHVAYNNRATAWLEKGHFDKALDDACQAIRINPSYGVALYSRGLAWYGKKDYGNAIQDFQKAISFNPELGRVYSEYAWILATCPDAKYRDGKRSLDLSRKACEMSGWSDPYAVRAFAAASAETNDFESAVTWQSHALKILDREEYGSIDKTAFRSALSSFMRKAPYRTPPEESCRGNWCQGKLVSV